jgi:hypothetical protein
MKPAALALFVLAAVLATVGAALALASSPRQQALVDTTVRFLQENQQTSGGFASPGQEPSQSISAWVALALAGAGINPLDQSRCGTDAYTYLVDHFGEGLEEEIASPEIAITSFERELLVVDATGTDPHTFAGYDLVAEILGRQLPDGGFPFTSKGVSGESNDTIFAILALSPIHEQAVEEAVDRAAEWVVSAQNEDGGWYYSGRNSLSETDMTGAALEALVAAGAPAAEPQLAAYQQAEERGLEYLRRSQLTDGGFPAVPQHESESNVASAAWSVQGIWATGGNPETWTVGPEAREPLDYMESLQQPDGHIRWKASNDMNGIWMTAYVTPAFAGQALPIPLAARGDARASHGEAADCLDAGQGGESPKPGKGVLAGGGGHKAPAFSRPKRQSKGKTPGGARVVRNAKIEARDHSHDRRGDNVTQPRGTQTAEATDPREATRALRAELVGGGETEGEVEATPTAAAAGGGPGDGPTPGSSGPTGAAALPAAAAGPEPGQEALEVSGTVIGSPPHDGGGPLAFGAPGLRSAGAGSGSEDQLALAIGIAALLAALGGAGWQRRREGALT